MEKRIVIESIHCILCVLLYFQLLLLFPLQSLINQSINQSINPNNNKLPAQKGLGGRVSMDWGRYNNEESKMMLSNGYKISLEMKPR